MPIVSLHHRHPLEDNRQSARALAVRRGVQTWLDAHDACFVPEMPLANGRRADLAAIARDGEIVIIEIKSSLADLKADRKWTQYRDYADRVYFATLDDVPVETFPDDAGLLIADRSDACLLRDAPLHKLSAARRKAVTLRIARFAARRLYAAELSVDPTF